MSDLPELDLPSFDSGAFLADLREEMYRTKTTQEMLSLAAGVGRPQIANFLSNRTGLSLEPFLRICLWLGIDPTEYLDGDLPKIKRGPKYMIERRR
jgi:transcriptional regulator with XRE-family HTH domain